MLLERLALGEVLDHVGEGLAAILEAVEHSWDALLRDAERDDELERQ